MASDALGQENLHHGMSSLVAFFGFWHVLPDDSLYDLLKNILEIVWLYWPANIQWNASLLDFLHQALWPSLDRCVQESWPA